MTGRPIDVRDLVVLVARVLQQQRAYFAGRDRRDLEASKALERELRRAIRSGSATLPTPAGPVELRWRLDPDGTTVSGLDARGVARAIEVVPGTRSLFGDVDSSGEVLE